MFPIAAAAIVVVLIFISGLVTVLMIMGVTVAAIVVIGVAFVHIIAVVVSVIVTVLVISVCHIVPGVPYFVSSSFPKTATLAVATVVAPIRIVFVIPAVCVGPVIAIVVVFVFIDI